MKALIAAAALAASLPAFAGADVGVSIGISQPGVYGRIDIGRFPQPAVIATQPVLVAPPPPPVVVGAPVVMAPEPVYMWVPPGHRAHWERYCGRYHACGRPVYFVDDRWYHEHVMAERHEHHHHDRDDDHGRGH